VSSDAAFVKAIRVPAGARHLCYCHSPPRYVWNMLEFHRGSQGLRGRLLPWFAGRLRRSDALAAGRVDVFVANSAFVQERIRACYGRESTVVHPPVEVSRFRHDRPRGPRLAVVSELVAYKRVELVLEAAARAGLALDVVGDGPERARLERSAGGDVRFLGRLDDAGVAGVLETCRALLHPQCEDFGITAVEAMAAGAPVVAYAGGGALETVLDGATGRLVARQEAAAFVEALRDLERTPAEAAVCRRRAEEFAPERFRATMRGLVSGLIHRPV
jgi:glycosyltransferase involved in cell wall biosynthesis